MIFGDFSNILAWTASLFQKINFKTIIFAIHAITFHRFDQVFLDGLNHEAPLDSLLENLMKKHFASEIALHESCK